MDFIVELPLAGSYDAVLDTMDCITKMAHFPPMTSNITMEQTTQLYYQHVWKLHRVPEDIVSDRSPQFVSHFMRCLSQKLEIQGIGRQPTSHSRVVRWNGLTERWNSICESIATTNRATGTGYRPLQNSYTIICRIHPPESRPSLLTTGTILTVLCPLQYRNLWPL